MAINEYEGRYQYERPVRVTPKADIQRRLAEERSTEIQTMRMYMRRYPDKAKDYARELFGFLLTKDAA